MAASSRPSRPKQQRLNPTQTGRSANAAAGKPAGKSGKPGASKSKPQPPRAASVGDWISGARLRTLPLAIAPVALGTGAAVVANGNGHWEPLLAVLCLAVALFLQIGVNYANDYSDGIRGTDEHRIGPARLTGSGTARAKQVLYVSLAFFALAAIAGLSIVLITQQWWLLAVGAAAIAAAWFYTGGKHPYGYYGLGEVFVFVFFGLVATCGTTWVQAGTINTESWLSGVAIGLIACAVLMVNNLRDVAPDTAAGKRTLAVLVGQRAGRVLFCVFLLVPFLIAGFFALFYPIATLTFFVLLLALPACLITVTAKTAPELILALKLTSFAALAYGIALGAAFAF